MIGVMVEYHGIAAAEGVQHLMEGFVIFTICVAVLLAEVWLLLRIGPRGRFLTLDVLKPRRADFVGLGNRPAPVSLQVAAVLALAGFMTTTLVTVREEIIPFRTPFSQFPLQIATWLGMPVPLAPEYLKVLQLTDYAQRSYVRRDEHGPVDFYVAYYDSQRYSVATYSPQECIPGGGWVIRSVDRVAIDSVPGRSTPLEVSRAVIARQGMIQVVYVTGFPSTAAFSRTSREYGSMISSLTTSGLPKRRLIH